MERSISFARSEQRISVVAFYVSSGDCYGAIDVARAARGRAAAAATAQSLRGKQGSRRSPVLSMVADGRAGCDHRAAI